MLIFVDPYCFADSVSSQKSYITQETPEPSASNLPNLFSAWGIQFSQPKEVVVAPENAYHALNDPLGKEHPAILNLTREMMDQKDIIMTGLNRLNLVFAGAFSGSPTSRFLKKTILLKTTLNSGLLTNFSYKMPTPDITNAFSSDNRALDLMVRLSGIFQTAFPNGVHASKNRNKAVSSDNTINLGMGNEISYHKVQNNGQDKHNNILQQSIKPSSVILVGNADMLFDSFCVGRQQVDNKAIIDVINSNLSFVKNAVDHLSGDHNIINIRSRGTIERNFAKIENFYKEAQKKYQKK